MSEVAAEPDDQVLQVPGQVDQARAAAAVRELLIAVGDVGAPAQR